MSTKNVGNPLQGRRLKGGNSGQEPIAIKADNGDTTTAGSATPFLEFTNAKIDGSDKDGSTNLTVYAVSGLTPGATDVEGVLCSINGVKYWIPVYKAD
mgnify:FL=1|jgi:hypothetical protein|tara:strand:+ start:79 stop:372 length:294 start_codon:yes stop_codon:yes gene_type:complete